MSVICVLLMAVYCSTYVVWVDLVVLQPAYTHITGTVLNGVLYHISTSGYRCILSSYMTHISVVRTR